MSGRRARVFSLAARACVAIAVVAAGAASAATYTVTTTADSGAGSLRQAITNANGHAGADVIAFAVPGTGVHTIAPLSELPAVTDTVTIDGYTQPGSHPNTLAGGDDGLLRVDLSGVAAPAGAEGLVLQHDGCIVRGLAIHGFHPENGSSGGDGIVVNANGCIIAGNFVGTDPSGVVADGNTEAISISGNANRVGGLSTADRNLIVASVNAVGVRASGDATVIQGNFIGLDATGYGDLGNRGAGIFIGGQTATIGGTNPAAANAIAFNGGAVIVPDGASAGIAILRNAIFGNQTNSRGMGGIDLGYDGLTGNDACDGDTGANGLQNSPVLTSAVSDSGTVDLAFTLNSEPSTPYRVEFFASHECDSSGSGQGQYFIGAVTAMTDAGCNVSATAHLPVCLEGQFVITATATNPAVGTSEFSSCLPLTVAAGTNCRTIIPAPPPAARVVHGRD
ncbi:MAG TPA: hypothetical protein VKH46_01055 [Thermoanaerobaculia bacterium]|nr:hypothetical protein [Thermoanaerobaculia bacterium]